MSKLPKDLLQHRGQSERASKCRSLHHSIISNYEIRKTLDLFSGDIGNGRLCQGQKGQTYPDRINCGCQDCFGGKID